MNDLDVFSFVGFVLLATVSVTNAITCSVCLPNVRGTVEDGELIMLWRANITRELPKVPEAELGDCPEYEPNDAKFQRNCEESVKSVEDDETSLACVLITNGKWTGRTCGRVPIEHRGGNIMIGDITYSTCKTDLCNYNSASTLSYSVVLSVLAFVLSCVLSA